MLFCYSCVQFLHSAGMNLLKAASFIQRRGCSTTSCLVFWRKLPFAKNWMAFCIRFFFFFFFFFLVATKIFGHESMAEVPRYNTILLIHYMVCHRTHYTVRYCTNITCFYCSKLQSRSTFLVQLKKLKLCLLDARSENLRLSSKFLYSHSSLCFLHY